MGKILFIISILFALPSFGKCLTIPQIRKIYQKNYDYQKIKPHLKCLYKADKNSDEYNYFIAEISRLHNYEKQASTHYSKAYKNTNSLFYKNQIVNRTYDNELTLSLGIGDRNSLLNYNVQYMNSSNKYNHFGVGFFKEHRTYDKTYTDEILKLYYNAYINQRVYIENELSFGPSENLFLPQFGYKITPHYRLYNMDLGLGFKVNKYENDTIVGLNPSISIDDYFSYGYVAYIDFSSHYSSIAHRFWIAHNWTDTFKTIGGFTFGKTFDSPNQVDSFWQVDLTNYHFLTKELDLFYGINFYNGKLREETYFNMGIKWNF